MTREAKWLRIADSFYRSSRRIAMGNMSVTSIPLVSIILTTLDSERFVARSIESCLNQTIQDIELLVVDGGSQDRTIEIVRQYSDPRVRLIHQPKNTGKLPGAINLGMENALGAFITWTQDDCWYEIDAIETMLDFLTENPNVSFVYTDYWEVDVNGTPTRYQHVKPVDSLVQEGDVLGTSFLFRRLIYETIGPQEVKYYSVHELPWRIKVAQSFCVEPLHLPLMYYTVHADSLTGRFGHWNEQRKAIRVLLQEGHISREAYRKRVARIDIDEAFEHYVLYGCYRGFWIHMLKGISRDPHLSLNVGMWKLAANSLLPTRGKYRDQLFRAWQTEEEDRQNGFLQRVGAKSTRI